MTEKIEITGLDVQLQTLPTVASKYATINTNKLDIKGDDIHMLNLIAKSRKYLNLLLDLAIGKLEK